MRALVAWRMLWACVGVAGAATMHRSAHAQTCPSHASAITTGNVATNALTEASGIAASRKNSGVLWSHNDSGGSNNLFAMGYNGAHLGSFTLSGATAVDWEDIAIGPGPSAGVDYLYVGDMGDNLNIRSTIKVYRVAEPTVNPSSPQGNVTLRGVATITLAYPDGARDAETLMVDTNGDIYIVTKRVSAVGRVYRAAFPQSTSSTVVLTYVASIPWGAVNGSGGATGGDIAHDGSAVIVRRGSQYSPNATLWRRAPGTPLADVFAQPGCNITLPSEPQGEAVAFSPHNLSLFTISEGANQPIHFMRQSLAPGDVNGDEAVDTDDLLKLLGAWGPCPASALECPGDVDNSGAIDTDDLLAQLGNWG